MHDARERGERLHSSFIDRSGPGPGPSSLSGCLGEEE